VLFGLSTQAQGLGVDINNFKQGTEDLSLSSVKITSFYACLTSISSNEIVMVKFSPHRIPGSKEQFRCNQFDDVSLTDVILSHYANYLGKLSIDISPKDDKSDGAHFSYICRETGLKGVFGRPCGDELVQAVKTDAANFLTQTAQKPPLINPKRATPNDLMNAFKNNALIDDVARTLNVSSGCDENGCLDSFWYAENQDSCIYRKAGINNYTFTPRISEIRMRELNPERIKIANEQIKLGTNSLTVTTVRFNKQTLFLSMNQLDLPNLNKRWEAIFTQSCPLTK
jgi:hypothetical protein